MTQPTDHSDTTGFLAGAVTVFLTLLGWSIVPIILRYFSQEGHHIDVWTSNGWRYGFSAVLWLPVVLMGLRRGRLPRGIWLAALVPSAVNASAQVLFAWSHYKIDPGLITFGLRFQMVFVAVGAYLLFPNERRVVRAPAYIAGFVLVMVGSLAVVLDDRAASSFDEAVGVLMAVGSGLTFALYGLSVRYFMTRVNPIKAFAVISLYTAIVLVTLMVLLGEDSGASAFDLGPLDLALLLVSAVIGIALGHVGYYYAISKLGVAVSTGIIQLQPFIVAGISLVMYHERLAPTQWAGGITATIGAMLMLAIQRRMSRTIRAEAVAAEDAR